MISTQVVESSFNNSSFQNYPHPEDYTKGHTCIYADYKFYNSWVQKHGDRGAGEQGPIEEFVKGGLYTLITFNAIDVDDEKPRSQGPLSFSLEKVPCLRLVTCLCIQMRSAPRVGLWLKLCQHCLWRWKLLCLTDVILEVSKLFVRDPAWPVLLLAKHWTNQTLNECINVTVNGVILPIEKYKSSFKTMGL